MPATTERSASLRGGPCVPPPEVLSFHRSLEAMRFRFVATLPPLLLPCLLALGCGGSAKSDAGTNVAPLTDGGAAAEGDIGDEEPLGDVALLDGKVSCTMDPRVDTYTAGLA